MRKSFKNQFKRRSFSKNLFLITALVLSMSLLVACGGTASPTPSPSPGLTPAPDSASAGTDNDKSDFDAIIEAARGTTVTFYGWGGDENRNKWLRTTVGQRLKEEYDLTLDLVPMDIDQILNKLSGEKQANLDKGTIDMIWINGENFYSAMENGMLHGPFVDQLPSFHKYIDATAEENNFDFGYPIRGYEAPYGKAQMVWINDAVRTPETPASTSEFLEYAKKYQGQVTYPAPPDFTGSAFVRNVIYDILGHEIFMDMPADKDFVREAIQPAMEYLRSLNPYLWNQGKTFPATSPEQDNMFADNELVFTMSYAPYTVALNIDKGVYAETTQTFVWDKGTVGNTSYIAIADNAPNKAGAMVAINYIISAEGQASQFAELLTLPVVDNSKLSADEMAAFDAVNIGKGTLSQDEVLGKRLPEMPAQLVPIIEEIWLEEVVGK